MYQVQNQGSQRGNHGHNNNNRTISWTPSATLGRHWKIQKTLNNPVVYVAPLKSLYFHWTAICNSSIVFTPRSFFLLFALLFSVPIVEDLTTAATPPKQSLYTKANQRPYPDPGTPLGSRTRILALLRRRY